MMLHAEAEPVRTHLPAAVRPGAPRTRHLLSILGLPPGEVPYLARRAVRIRHAPAAPATLRGRTGGVNFRKTHRRAGDFARAFFRWGGRSSAGVVQRPAAALEPVPA